MRRLLKAKASWRAAAFLMAIPAATVWGAANLSFLQWMTSCRSALSYWISCAAIATGEVLAQIERLEFQLFRK